MDATLSMPPDGNKNKSAAIIGMMIGALTLSCIIVALRMYTRTVLLKSTRWDDWTIVLALVLCIPSSYVKHVFADWGKIGTIIGTGLDFLEVLNGFGRHQYYLTDHQFQQFKKYTYGEWIQTFLTLMFTKISVCLLLLRISLSQRIIRPIYCLVYCLFVSTAILIVFWIFQCVPVDAAWDLAKQPDAQCFSMGKLQRIIISQASKFAFGTDSSVFLTPV